jgi:hypothetical protein
MCEIYPASISELKQTLQFNDSIPNDLLQNGLIPLQGRMQDCKFGDAGPWQVLFLKAGVYAFFSLRYKYVCNASVNKFKHLCY